MSLGHLCVKRVPRRLRCPSYLSTADRNTRLFSCFASAQASDALLSKQISTDLHGATRSVSAAEARRLCGEVKLCLMGHSVSDGTCFPPHTRWRLCSYFKRQNLLIEVKWMERSKLKTNKNMVSLQTEGQSTREAPRLCTVACKLPGIKRCVFQTFAGPVWSQERQSHCLAVTAFPAGGDCAV